MARLPRRLSTLLARLDAGAAHDPALKDVIALLEPARIQLIEAARELRAYRQKLDLDPSELARVEERQAAIHDVARKYRSRPEALPDLLLQTDARLAALAQATDSEALAKRATATEAAWRRLAHELTKKRRFAAHELEGRVTHAMQELAMKGGRFEIALLPLATPTSHGSELLEFRVSSHPKQPLGPLAKVASGGELSRIALAIQVVTSEVGEVPTLIFDEVDVGIGGAVAATVGRLLQGARESPPGAVRDAPAASRRLCRRPLSRHQAWRRRCRPRGGRGARRRRAGRGAGADGGGQRDHRRRRARTRRNCSSSTAGAAR